MGGKAISKITSNPIRIGKETYAFIKSYINILCKEKDQFVRFTVIDSLPGKDSFGDIDILIAEDAGFNRSEFEIAMNFELNQNKYPILKNGPASSLVLDLENTGQFQIDFIYVDPEDFEISKNYHGKEDLGNLLGRIFNGLGCKFTHRGLVYRHIIDDQLRGEIVLSKDYSKILDSIGLDSNRVKEISTREELYEFVVSSPFFNPSYFLLENRNHAARVRDSKRPSYMEFLNYIKDFSDRNSIADKNYYISLIFHFGKETEYLNLLREDAIKNLRKAVVNPTHIKNVTNFTREELGKVVKSLRSDLIFSDSNLLNVPFRELRSILDDMIEPLYSKESVNEENECTWIGNGLGRCRRDSKQHTTRNRTN